MFHSIHFIEIKVIIEKKTDKITNNFLNPSSVI